MFGEVIEGQMRLNEAGEMVQRIWDELPRYDAEINVDVFQIMPNHVHGIILIDREAPVGVGPCAYPHLRAEGQAQGLAPTTRAKRMSLGDVVHRFKTMTTRLYIKGVRSRAWRPFAKRLWQRNYYEHIIRNEENLQSIREYILYNPLKWQEDELFIQS